MCSMMRSKKIIWSFKLHTANSRIHPINRDRIQNIMRKLVDLMLRKLNMLKFFLLIQDPIFIFNIYIKQSIQH